MLDKLAEKAAKVFSKKAVEQTKQAIVEDVKQNHTGYVMAGITGVVIAIGVVSIIKFVVTGAAPRVPTYSITYNYNYYLSPEQASTIMKGLPGK